MDKDIIIFINVNALNVIGSVVSSQTCTKNEYHFLSNVNIFKINVIQQYII